MNDVIMSGVQTLVVKSDQEALIVDVKNSLTCERCRAPRERLLRTLSGCMEPCLNQAVLF